MELYMVVIGGKPEGRHTEQHDVFFGVGASLKDLVPQMESFWPELAGKMHIDSWRKVSKVNEFTIQVVPKTEQVEISAQKLYFVNLGGYKPEDMEEYHYKQVVVADSLAEATRLAKSSTFWKHHDSSHIDDKYGIDVDDIYEISDLLNDSFKTNYSLKITPAPQSAIDDTLEVGYLKISKLLSWD
ncbi:DUF1543 domain-containing protein [Sphingobacterium sp. lm-10]|uniref:DUF1543 domain-containing protein n=1 Tax=Sphingobacterium sp. lm-10 TaxID=2944904 RepID=UPI002022039B|nr:DUF1543 domain-containing protein [Sphingobacterium sp. lm-10]MCL7986555.1 DUF1543 domain-containing protein [Sphingobacterium sp. lm-10]